MRRVLLLFALAFLVVSRAHAQTEASVYIRLWPDSLNGPHPRVRVMSLLDDPVWRKAVQQSVPVRLEWSIELWSKGGFAGIGSKLGGRAEWREMVQWKPTLEIFELTTEVQGQALPPQQFKNIDLLSYQLGRAWELDQFGPRSSGNWYYIVTLKLSTLTEDEIARLDPSQQRGDGEGGGVVRFTNRLLLGLIQPAKTLTQRSEYFRFTKR